MEKSDHIALTLSTNSITGLNGEETPLTSSSLTRKSFRRSWNQLPRCQRNLIILGMTAFLLTLLLFLPGDQLVDGEERSIRKKFGINGESPLPFHVNKDIIAHGLRRNLGENANDEIAESAVGAEPPKAKGISVDDKLNAIVDNFEPNSVESIMKLPDAPPVQKALQNGENDEQYNSLHLEDLNNNIEEPAAAVKNEDDFRPSMDSAVREPTKLFGKSIAAYIEDANVPKAEKQHFHGATNTRQEAVVAAFKHSWNGYKQYAWGHDNLKPISHTSHDWFGLGLTIVDSLDTMYIMGLEEEFQEARDWVNTTLRFNTSRDVNLFEVTIRVLGGLLSAYHLSGDKMFLYKSVELGNRLLPSFLSPSGIPYSDVNLGDLSAHSPKWSPDSSTSEVTTIQLEFRDLSRSTNVSIYERVVNEVNDKVHALEKQNGLVPIFINAHTGTFRNYATISLGARGDSYYEYLLKQWLQTGRKENDYLILDYMHAIDGVLTKLLRRTPKEHHVYVGELINGKEFKPKMDHLTCYLPGTLLLGHENGMPDAHLVLAKDLLETCYQTYVRQPTKLAPEITYFSVNENDEQDIYVKPNDAHNLLRPEFIESLYYFYALTGDRKYQDMGWLIFQAFEQNTKVSAGYTSIGNVKNASNTRLRDMMESFWLSETLKYFYLLFSDNRKEIDLGNWVFNSEGHPLPMRLK